MRVSLSRSEASATVRRAIDRLARAGKSKQALLRRRRGWGRPGCERDSRVTQSGRLDRSALHPSTPFRALEARAGGTIERRDRVFEFGPVQTSWRAFARLPGCSLTTTHQGAPTIRGGDLDGPARISAVPRPIRSRVIRSARVNRFANRACGSAEPLRSTRLSRVPRTDSRGYVSPLECDEVESSIEEWYGPRTLSICRPSYRGRCTLCRSMASRYSSMISDL